MSTTWCPAPTSPAYGLVGTAQEKFMSLGDELYRLTTQNMRSLDASILDPVDFNVSFNFDGQLAKFVRPPAPVLSAADFTIRLPGDIAPAPGFASNTPAIDAAPEFSEAAPTLSYGVKPSRPNVSAPTAPASHGPLVIPDEPDYVLPELPTFEQLQLPVLPNVEIPEFTAKLPELIEPPFDDSWTFNPTAYESYLKEMLYSAIEPMLQSKPALPQAIENAIFGRMRSRIEAEAGRDREQAFNEFAVRGWNTPQGPLNAALANIRRDSKNRIGDAARDTAIKQYEETLANLRLALAQGAALEGVYANIHVEEQRYLLEGARFQRETTLALLNYRLAVFQARMSGYQTEAQVLRDRIQAELAKVEVYRAQIEGQRLIGDINDQRVRLYATQVQTVNAMADFYRTRIEAVKAQADVIRLDYDKYRTEMEAYDVRWKAYATEWQGYSASVDGEAKRADLYRTLVQAHSASVDVWQTKQNFKVDLERLRINQHDQQLQAWKALLEKRASDLDAERARLAAVSSYAGAQAQIYNASASVEQAASAATDRSFELGLAKERANVETQLENVRLMISQAQTIMQNLLSVADTKVKVGAQLAASSWSAVNYSASVSASVGQSSSCSSNFSFQGEIIDA